MISIDLLGLSPIDFLYCFCVSYVVNALVAVDLFAAAGDWARSTALDPSQPENEPHTPQKATQPLSTLVNVSRVLFVCMIIHKLVKNSKTNKTATKKFQ